jgi:hypothetical protein
MFEACRAIGPRSGASAEDKGTLRVLSTSYGPHEAFSEAKTAAIAATFHRSTGMPLGATGAAYLV